MRHFCVFLEDDKMDLRQFFSGFRKKYLFITELALKNTPLSLRTIAALAGDKVSNFLFKNN